MSFSDGFKSCLCTPVDLLGDSGQEEKPGKGQHFLREQGEQGESGEERREREQQGSWRSKPERKGGQP